MISLELPYVMRMNIHMLRPSTKANTQLYIISIELIVKEKASINKSSKFLCIHKSCLTTEEIEPQNVKYLSPGKYYPANSTTPDTTSQT